MKTIQELDQVEAVYTLYMATQKTAQHLDLDDAEQATAIVRDAFVEVAGQGVATEVMLRFRDDAAAAGIARACLETLREQPVVGVSTDELNDLLTNPPRADKLDLGVTLGTLALAGLAMTLLATFELDKATKETRGGTKTSHLKIRYRGNEKAIKIVQAVLTKIGVLPQ